ncbi:family 16 glycosylhydrolase [Persicobacter psychrovividus]|uniref:GH16 domain-containing protein n=1 Tax=Persicobacter psychrovividus TaxID=387638 RepID=A0ABN6LGK9_9BACT|nr:hypothetical protein PEPS_45200 [Persicobacter psychrovividus]
MKKLFTLLFICCASQWASAQSDEFPQLLWADEFNGSGLPDADAWNYDLGDGGFGNNELQNYTNNLQNVKMEAGLLKITAKKESYGYSSARIKTQGQKNFTYGRVEVRAKLPKGRGTWPAIWMLGENISSVGWPACGEIDIMEYVGFEPGIVHSSTHTPSSYGATVNTQKYTLSTAESAFHNYILEWTETALKFYVDDELIYTYAPAVRNASTWPFDKPHFIILNLAIGGTWGGAQGVDDSIFPQQLLVDYVRVYGKVQAPEIQGATIIEAESEQTFTVATMDDADYEWVVPTGVEILQGQGTGTVQVKWHGESDVIKLKMTHDNEVYWSEHAVTVKKKPTGHVFDLSLNQWEVSDKHLGEIAVNATAEEATIDFDITQPSSIPYLDLTFNALFDLSEDALMSIDIATTDAPANMRIDWIDHSGQVFSNGEVFNTEQWAMDGQFHRLHHNYASLMAAHRNFDFTQVKGLRFYLNYGAFAEAKSGQIKVKGLKFEPAENLQLPAAVENSAVEELAGQGVLVSWLSVGDWVKGTKILRSRKGDNDAPMSIDLPTGQQSFLDEAVKNGKTYDYSIVQFNQLGEGEAVELQSITVEHMPLSSAISSDLKVYPNPCDQSLIIEGNWGGNQYEICNVLGKLQQSSTVPQNGEIFTGELTPGLYWLRLILQDGRVVYTKFLKRG